MGGESAVIMLHGGLDHSGNWGYQIPMLAIASCSSTAVATDAAHAMLDLSPTN